MFLFLEMLELCFLMTYVLVCGNWFLKQIKIKVKLTPERMQNHKLLHSDPTGL